MAQLRDDSPEFPLLCRDFLEGKKNQGDKYADRKKLLRLMAVTCPPLPPVSNLFRCASISSIYSIKTLGQSAEFQVSISLSLSIVIFSIIAELGKTSMLAVTNKVAQRSRSD